MLNRRAVPSNTIGPRFESSHRQSFVMNIFTVNYQKDKIRKKMAGNGPFFIKKLICSNWRRIFTANYWKEKKRPGMFAVTDSVLCRIFNIIFHTISTFALGDSRTRLLLVIWSNFHAAPKLSFCFWCVLPGLQVKLDCT